MGDTLQRKTHNAFASLRVSYKAISGPPDEHEGRFSFFVPIAEWRANKTTPLANLRNRWITKAADEKE